MVALVIKVASAGFYDGIKTEVEEVHKHKSEK